MVKPRKIGKNQAKLRKAYIDEKVDRTLKQENLGKTKLIWGKLMENREKG